MAERGGTWTSRSPAISSIGLPRTMYLEDTITAIATSPGPGGIGIIRISGPESLALAGSVYCPTGPGGWQPHTLRHGWLEDAEGRRIDECLAVFMPAGQSYTGEDVVELQCHGSPPALRSLIAILLARGARLAQPGEFTQRAFLNGRLDLAQAEAVADLIEATGREAATLAADQLGGGLSRELDAMRTALVESKALLEVQIDFSEEEVTVDTKDVRVRLSDVASGLARLVESFDQGKRVRDGFRATLVGAPNVGKSSLLNALLGEERAIVTEVAGTTRDVIEEGIEVGGVAVVLGDTAGLRDARAAEPIERVGMERTVAAIERADVLLVVVDGSRESVPGERRRIDGLLENRGRQAMILVVNKTDLPQVAANSLRDGRWDAVVEVSARERSGLGSLREALAGVIERANGDAGGPVLTNERHRATLARAGEAAVAAQEALLAGEPVEIIAVAVQDALDGIAEVVGRISREDVLDEVFSRFCIGK